MPDPAAVTPRALRVGVETPSSDDEGVSPPAVHRPPPEATPVQPADEPDHASRRDEQESRRLRSHIDTAFGEQRKPEWRVHARVRLPLKIDLAEPRKRLDKSTEVEDVGDWELTGRVSLMESDLDGSRERGLDRG